MSKNSRQNVNILRTKRAFKINKKKFLIIFNGFLLNQIKQLILVDESLTLIPAF